VATECFYAPDNSSIPGESLTWTVASPPGDSQRVELSSEPPGLQSGHSQGSRPIPGTDAGFSWRDLKVGQTYTWRVITTSGTATSPSPPQTFVAQPCAGGYSGP